MVAAVTTRKNGFAEMAYVGETPWHGLGQALSADADIDTWKTAAGMDWKIQRSMVRYATERGTNNFMELPDQHVLFRSDSKAPLGLVSSKYKIVQPGEVLEFFRDLTEANGYTLNTAGTLFDGKRFWALASIGEEAVVLGNDKIGGYLLLSTSCDGSLATTARFTTIRVVCNNTLSMALHAKDKKEVKVRHNSFFNAESMKDQLGLARGQFGEFIKATRQLASIELSTADAGEFLGELLKDAGTVTADDVTKTKPYQKIMELFNGAAMGSDLDGVLGTGWGMINSVTEYVDHHAKSASISHRLDSAWFGRGDDLKTAAFEKLLVRV